MKYAVSLLLRGEFASGDSPIWELVVLCIEGSSKEKAKEQAKETGKTLLCEYRTATGESLRWKLHAVHKVEPVDPFPPVHGSELFLCSLGEQEAESLMEPFDS